MPVDLYKVHPKHRAAKPSVTASVWSVSKWREIALFAEAGAQAWRDSAKNWLYAMDSDQGQLGRGLNKGSLKEVNLYMAKFVEDNKCWHGYPVHPRGDDIPPEKVLEDWFNRKMITKAQRLKIQGGQFK